MTEFVASRSRAVISAWRGASAFGATVGGLAFVRSLEDGISVRSVLLAAGAAITAGGLFLAGSFFLAASEHLQVSPRRVTVNADGIRMVWADGRVVALTWPQVGAARFVAPELVELESSPFCRYAIYAGPFSALQWAALRDAIAAQLAAKGRPVVRGAA